MHEGGLPDPADGAVEQVHPWRAVGQEEGPAGPDVAAHMWFQTRKKSAQGSSIRESGHHSSTFFGGWGGETPCAEFFRYKALTVA